MSDIIITLMIPVQNVSLQKGDIAYSVTAGTSIQGQNTSTGTPKKVGTIIDVTGSQVTIKNANGEASYTPAAGEFLMFSKNKNVNNTSLVGYFAEVELENNSTTKAELFTLGSEVAVSSK